MKRNKYTVSWDKAARGWFVSAPEGEIATRYKSKAMAVAAGRKVAKWAWKFLNKLAQLVVKLKNGRIQNEYTYGKDPVRYKG